MILSSLPTAEQESRWAALEARSLDPKHPWFTCRIAAVTPREKETRP